MSDKFNFHIDAREPLHEPRSFSLHHYYCKLCEGPSKIENEKVGFSSSKKHMIYGGAVSTKRIHGTFPAVLCVVFTFDLGLEKGGVSNVAKFTANFILFFFTTTNFLQKSQS